VRLNGRTVDIFIKGERVGNVKHMTAADHMPSRHREPRMLEWRIGAPSAARVVILTTSGLR